MQKLIDYCERDHKALILKDDGPSGTYEEYLCLWGIAMANLLRHKGVLDHIDYQSQLIPRDLVI